MKQIIMILHLMILSYCHFIPKLTGETFSVSQYVNQASQIPIPFKKCFFIRPQLEANKKLLNFQSSSLNLHEIQKVIISKNREIPVLEDLRSPRANVHQHLIVFQAYALTFSPPNEIKVIEMDEFQNYKTTKIIPIKEIDEYTRFKMYKFGNRAMLLLERDQRIDPNAPGAGALRTKAYLVDQSGYFPIQVPFTDSVAHLQADGKQFFTAQYGKGIYCYSYIEQKQSAIQVGKYQKSLFTNITPYLYIVDINIKHVKNHKIIYILDTIKGVFRLNLTSSLKSPKIDLIINQPNCHAMDSINLSHIVLVCQLGRSSYIVEAYGKINEQGEMIFEKQQPEYHVNFFNDLEINKDYFLVFSQRQINVYWSSKQNNIPQTVNTRSQLDLSGLQTFYFRMNVGSEGQSYLYAIQSGVLKQFQITESPAKLLVKSDVPFQKGFKVSIFGNCQDLPKSEVEKLQKLQTFTNSRNEYKNLTCEVQILINLQTYSENSPRKQDFSVSASIIVILIVIFLLIIWICLKKYKGLQKEARRVLDAYKKKKSRTSRI